MLKSEAKAATDFARIAWRSLLRAFSFFSRFVNEISKVAHWIPFISIS